MKECISIPEGTGKVTISPGANAPMLLFWANAQLNRIGIVNMNTGFIIL